ncbi:hypothetical protein GFS31_36010 [Leptolyngbya sp. BL0902]|nr:hypothetical protein GFS31_36010 [Leptolyngbya sp. BL0902]
MGLQRPQNPFCQKNGQKKGEPFSSPYHQGASNIILTQKEHEG